jgi:hypothetical protein
VIYLYKLDFRLLNPNNERDTPFKFTGIPFTLRNVPG